MHFSFEGLQVALNCYFLFRPGTTIAAAVGGVVLFFILLGLLVFYLRRQNKLKRKETVRRYLQEQEVSTRNDGAHRSWLCVVSGV